MTGYTKKEIVGTLTGTFIFKPKNSGLKTLEGDGTIVVRDETMLNKDTGLYYHQYYATIYGEFEPTETTIYSIQKGRFYDGGNKYDVFLKKVTDEIHLGVAFVGESLGQRAFRYEFSGKVLYDIRNKYGRTGKVVMVGKSVE